MRRLYPADPERSDAAGRHARDAARRAPLQAEARSRWPRWERLPVGRRRVDGVPR